MCRNGHFWIEITIRIVLVILFVYVFFKNNFSLFFGALKAFFPVKCNELSVLSIEIACLNQILMFCFGTLLYQFFRETATF